MKRKVLMTIGILISMILLIMVFLTVSNGNPEWFIERDEEQGISWYYELVDGEAVNVRTTGGNAKNLTKLVVPDTLGGYPVTSVKGKDGIRDAFWGYSAGNILESQPYYLLSTSVYKNYNLKEIVLPDTIREIGAHCFDNLMVLEKINIPASLQKVGKYAFANDVSLKEVRFENANHEFLNMDLQAFDGCNIEKLVIDNIETWNHIILGKTKKVEIGSNVKNIKGQIVCEEDAEIRIPSTVQYFSNDVFAGATDIWVDNEEENVEVDLEKNPGRAWVHFNNKEKILTNLPTGIKAINAETNEEFSTIKVQTGSNFTFKLEQAEGYNYEKYTVIIEGYSKNLDKTISKLDLRFGQEYTIENVTRDKTIYVETREDKIDLNLRQYIWGVNDVELVHSRAPIVEINEDRTLKYKHTKLPLYPKTGNKVRYGIRVYNEGLIDGTANKIKEYIPEGLRFDETSEINTQYGWVKSSDGRSASTEILSDKNIKSWTINNDIDYKEIFIELIVDAEESEEFTRLVTVAEIEEQSSIDADSSAGNIELPINSDFMKEESETSNVNSYIQCIEDDMDFDSISLSRKVIRPYSLTLNKIDGMDNQLLNGATFDLMDENKNVLKTGVTANGGMIDFGTIYAYGDKKTRYYIKETSTPEGYKNHIQYVIRLDVVPPKDDLIQAEDLKFEIDMQSIDVDTSKYEEIEISTKEQLKAIENNLDKKYVLTQDIDLDGEEWEPLNVENVMLDGKNHKITNLTINKSSDTTKKIGLFATYSGIIENLTLENVNLKSTKEITIPEEDKSVEEMDNYLNEIYNAEETENEIPAVGGIIAYSNNVILKNCKVTGNVKTEFKNVGGLVGHSKKGTIVVFRNCENEALVEAKKEYTFNERVSQYNSSTYQWENITNVTTSKEGRNAGGMIGVTLGPVYASNSINRGNIYAGKYNAGGFIGAAEEEEYVLNNVFGQYDENLNIFVRNERVNGNYNIKINKVDETGKNLLAGAKFSIYDRNKNVIEGYENIELTDGVLNIPETIYSIGTDTIYIKETEAPNGYVKLLDTYIKVEIEKTWDKETQEYKTKVETKTLTSTEMQNDIPKENNTSTVATGTTINNTQNQDVVLKTNDVTIDENSRNEGIITSECINAGGFVGRATCSVEAVDVKNTGEVIANIGNSAGIVAEIEVPEGRNSLLFVNNAINYGNIKQTSFNSNSNSIKKEKFSTAGIAGTVNSDVEIYNSTNNGIIESEAINMSGILASAFSDYLIIDNCTNNSIIKTTKGEWDNGSNSAGIIAQIQNHHKLSEEPTWSWETYKYEYQSENEHSKYVVSNCTNKANIEFSGNSGGIICTSYSKDLTVSNCKCEDTEFIINGSAYCEGGIIGKINNENLIIENCSLKNAKMISDSAEAIGGMLGVYGLNSRVNPNTKVEIKGCEVHDSELSTFKEAGGIVAEIAYGNIISVEDCEINNTNITAEADSAGGIIASTAEGDSQSKIIINNCEVKDGKINIVTGGSYSPSAAGIITKANNYEIEINNCHVCKTEIKNEVRPHDGNNTGGIIAYSYGKKATIKDTDVKYSNIKSNSKIGGIACVLGYNGSETIIENCHLKGSMMEDLEDSTLGSSGTIGGLVACLVSRNNSVTNCSVDILTNEEMEELEITNTTNNISKIKAEREKCAGAFGYIGGKCSIKNVDVKNTEIEANSNNDDNVNATFGGFIQFALSDELTLEDCQILNSTVKVKGYQVSGFIGAANANINLRRCVVNHSTIENNGEFTYDDYSASCAGIIGTNTQTTNIEDCQIINNSKIASSSGNVSGIIGYGKGTIQGCKFENSILEKTNTNGTQFGSINNISGISDNFNTNEINNCIVKNATFISNCDHVNGITGTLAVNNINNCTVQDLTIMIYNNAKIKENGSSNNVINIGGIKAINDADLTIENSTIKNIKIEKVDKEEAKDENYIRIGGLVGYSLGDITLNNNDISKITIDASKSNKTEDIGGLVAFSRQRVVYKNVDGTWKNVADDNETVINNLNLENINIKGGRNIGGLIGDGKNITITDTKLVDFNIGTSRSLSVVGGLIGRAQKDRVNNVDYPSKVVLNNIEFKTTGENTNNLNGVYTGIIVGMANEVSMLSEEDTSIVINNTNATASADMAGLIALANKIDNFKNITLNNCTIKASKNAGGIVGILNDSRDNSFENITLNNVNIVCKNTAGGILGVSSIGTPIITLKNINANNLFIDCSESTGGANVGGLVGQAVRINLDTANIKDLKLIQENAYNTGGLIGLITGYSGGSELKNIKITSSTGKTNQITTKTGSNSNSNNTGILLGFGSSITTSNINISNTSLDGGKCQNIGTLGAVENNTNNDITGITLDNVTITGEGNLNGLNIGGIAGFVKGPISLCTIKNCNISGTDEAKTKDGEKYRIGGIVGIISVSGSTTTKIEDCMVENSNINGDMGYVGGIAGFTSNKIINSTVKGSNVTNNCLGISATGGILGHGSNISGQDTNIKASKVVDTNITGNNKVGGISGGAVQSIKDCYIGKDENENIENGQYAVSIKGKDQVGAIIGDAGIIYSDSYLMLEMTGNRAEYVSITRNNVTGNPVPDNDIIIGTHNSFSESNTGDTTRTETLNNNVITNSELINAE